MDALEQLHPIEVEVPRARSIGELFDSISYKRDLLSLECCRVILLTIAVSHELAHLWLGSLVTMEWWSHLWLNEGFATWVSYMATDRQQHVSLVEYMDSISSKNK
ncbi:aminopeptidase M1-C-like isoform X2 [Quercus robur]|uniref:aminopeptidase M1-C-like isoform X2 n=1 Tax=Quercus robur TaxID=38942 RepID=UPI002161C8B5|nr:aminopeptidase M1-C-like isoform X2 [Quercus robur]